jgi:hypothetical protein
LASEGLTHKTVLKNYTKNYFYKKRNKTKDYECDDEKMLVNLSFIRISIEERKKE